jgi:ketosteroid isomerase-like protein
MSASSDAAKSVVDSHLQAFFRQSVDDVLRDYAEESVLIVPDRTLQGIADIRRFFDAFIGTLPAGFLQAFKMHRQEFAGELGYITWEASPWVRLATDTFIVRSGKILMQTFAAYPPLS